MQRFSLEWADWMALCARFSMNRFAMMGERGNPLQHHLSVQKSPPGTGNWAVCRHSSTSSTRRQLHTGMLVLSTEDWSLVSCLSTNLRASSVGTWVKSLVTSKLTSLSSGVICISWILSARTVEFFTVCCMHPVRRVKIHDSSFARLYVGNW